MRLTEPVAGARILAFGGYQPARVVTNDELAATVDTSDEWIRSRVGIASRRIAGPGRDRRRHGRRGGRQGAGRQRPVPPKTSTWSIVATCTPETQIPNVAATVARRLGINAPGAYDLNAACAGFCYALAAASDAVRAGTAGHVLVIGAEKLSQWVDWTDRSTCIIFADGAGAAVVGPGGRADRARHRAGRVGQRRRHGRQDLHQRPELVHPSRRARRCSGGPPPRCTRSPSRRASGPGWTPPSWPRSSRTRPTCASSRRSPASSARRRPGSPTTSCTAGNTSSASIPLALSRMIERGEIGSGDAVLLLGFGAGICYAAPGDHGTLTGLRSPGAGAARDKTNDEHDEGVHRPWP